MTKYAKLPSGKLLPFPDTMSERDMQRAVRKELGLQQEDLIGAIEALTDKLNKVVTSEREEAFNAIAKLVAPLTQEVTKLNKSTQGIEKVLDLQTFHSDQFINKVVKILEDITESYNKKITSSLDRVVAPLVESMTILSAQLTGFSKSIQSQLDHSTDAIKADLKTTHKAITLVDNINREMVQQLADTVATLERNARLRKRAHRSPNGEWIVEVIGNKTH